ncbi:hypothetical protein ERIN107935_05155 [Erysipelothrix inopinata]|nr:hypothetical protein [Erysipelothrix inopinata]
MEPTLFVLLFTILVGSVIDNYRIRKELQDIKKVLSEISRNMNE